MWCFRSGVTLALYRGRSGLDHRLHQLSFDGVEYGNYDDPNRAISSLLVEYTSFKRFFTDGSWDSSQGGWGVYNATSGLEMYGTLSVIEALRHIESQRSRSAGYIILCDNRLCCLRAWCLCGAIVKGWNPKIVWYRLACIDATNELKETISRLSRSVEIKFVLIPSRESKESRIEHILSYQARIS